MEIQKLILIDFTGLNGGIKKGSIDAILLSIEMIEKGFCTATGFPAENSHKKASFCFRGCQTTLKQTLWRLLLKIENLVKPSCSSSTQVFLDALSDSEVAQPLHLEDSSIAASLFVDIWSSLTNQNQIQKPI